MLLCEGVQNWGACLGPRDLALMALINMPLCTQNRRGLQMLAWCPTAWTGVACAGNRSNLECAGTRPAQARNPNASGSQDPWEAVGMFVRSFCFMLYVSLISRASFWQAEVTGCSQHPACGIMYSGSSDDKICAKSGSSATPDKNCTPRTSMYRQSKNKLSCLLSTSNVPR